MEKASLSKLAKELNLSISTISKALQDSHEISAKTKQLVNELARKYNYTPNHFASSLRKGKTKSIAVIIPEIANNFFALSVDAVHTYSTEKGYNVFVYLTHESLANEISVLKHLLVSRVDGIIMSLSSESKDCSHIQEFHAAADLPFVFFDRIGSLENFPRIITNNYESAFTATCHLLKQGAKNPVFLYTSEWLYISKERQNGFKDALIKNGVNFTEEHIIKCTEDDEINYSIIENLLSSQNSPDAIFTSIEKLALIVYKVAKDLSIKIPDQVKVISFSNLRAAEFLGPPLSTISQPAYEMGEQSVKLLFKMIEKIFYKNANDIIVIDSKLNIRGSSIGRN